MRLQSFSKYFALYPLAGMTLFACLSFAHDGFRTDRTIQSFYLPIAVGFSVGIIVGYLQDRMRVKTSRYERQLSKEREDAVLGRATAAIAHEVRNPLNAIGMGLQRLQFEAGELTPEHQQLVSLMLDSLARANGIIGNLLSYTRPPKPKFGDMRLDLLIDNLMMFYLGVCEEKNIKLSKRFTFSESMSADRNLISQAIQNVILNAIEAQPQGGFIEIEMRRKGFEVILSVRNGGIIIPTEQAESVFEPYFTTKTQGTGLGLPIARRIVEAHGGHMRCKMSDSAIEIVTYLPLNRHVEADL